MSKIHIHQLSSVYNSNINQSIFELAIGISVNFYEISFLKPRFESASWS